MNNRHGTFDYDVAILGGGSAGFAAAQKAIHTGLRTVVIENGAEVDGLCILRGCMPTKALMYAAEVLHRVNHADLWGIRAENVGFDFAKVMTRKNALIKGFADNRREQLESGKFKFLRAKASFIDPHVVAIDNEGTLSAANFIITTGSTIAPSPLPQLQTLGYLTSDDAIKLTQLPKSLIVLGGGAIAVELGQFFARFGVKVTLLQRGERVLGSFDTDATVEIERVLRREGIEIRTSTKLTDARRDGGLKTIVFQQGGQSMTVSAEEILFSLGRIPNTASLNLKNAGVMTQNGLGFKGLLYLDKKGAINCAPAE